LRQRESLGTPFARLESATALNRPRGRWSPKSRVSSARRREFSGVRLARRQRIQSSTSRRSGATSCKL